MTPEIDELVAMIVEAAARRERGEQVIDRSEDAARLVVAIGSTEDDAAFETLFATLGKELGKRGLKMPSLEELPPTVAPFAAAFVDALVLAPTGEVDMEATANELESRMESALGTSPRKEREARLREEIRRDMAAGTAAAMRRHGLTPACDLPDPTSTSPVTNATSTVSSDD